MTVVRRSSPIPGIDMLLREGRAGSIWSLEELHEDVVPDLEVAAAVARPLTGIAEFRAEVEVDLGVRTVRAGVADWTPPVVRELADPLLRHADLVAPNRVGIGVIRVDRWKEPIGRQSHHLGQELPRPSQRLPLEVVADRKVAEHEEEGAVGLVPDLLDVDCAEALLDRAEPVVRRRFERQGNRASSAACPPWSAARLGR